MQMQAALGIEFTQVTGVEPVRAARCWAASGLVGPDIEEFLCPKSLEMRAQLRAPLRRRALQAAWALDAARPLRVKRPGVCPGR